jgi:hypothetical protein
MDWRYKLDVIPPLIYANFVISHLNPLISLLGDTHEANPLYN